MNEDRVPYAGIVTRAVALGADVLALYLMGLVTAGLLALVASLVGGIEFGTLEAVIASVVSVLVIANYFVLFWWLAGQTPGMRLMHLRVISSTGPHLGLARSILRVIGLGLAIVPLFAGFLPVLVDDRRRALQDFLARTLVIYTDEEPEPEPPRRSASTLSSSAP